MVETSRRDVSTKRKHLAPALPGRGEEGTNSEMEILKEQTIKGYELKECLGTGAYGTK